jgi:hypothetical protein
MAGAVDMISAVAAVSAVLLSLLSVVVRQRSGGTRVSTDDSRTVNVSFSGFSWQVLPLAGCSEIVRHSTLIGRRAALALAVCGRLKPGCALTGCCNQVRTCNATRIFPAHERTVSTGNSSTAAQQKKLASAQRTSQRRGSGSSCRVGTAQTNGHKSKKWTGCRDCARGKCC